MNADAGEASGDQHPVDLRPVDPRPVDPRPVDPGFRDLGYARVDTDRLARTGAPEVVLAEHKTPDQTVGLLRELHAAHPGRAVLATRVPAGMHGGVVAGLAGLPGVVADPVGRTVRVGQLPPARGRVVVVAAGTSDAPVAAEAATTARTFGAGVEVLTDVGVAGVHRLLAVRDRLAAADCLVVVAGMEGALPSVVGGLTGVPLVAVPTSIGYGTGAGGLAAVLAMLNSCAPGVVVVNVDNGFGAGVHAARVATRAAGAAPP